MKAKWTNEDLEKEFKRLNKRFFGGQLNPLYVKFSKDLPDEHIGNTKAFRVLFKKGEDKFAIRISTKVQHMRVVWLSTLIHEMVHMEQKNKYSCGFGIKFNNRMKELAAAGAFNGVW